MTHKILKTGQIPADAFALIKVIHTIPNRRLRLQRIFRYIGSNPRKPVFPYKKSPRMNIYEHELLVTIITVWCRPFFKKRNLDVIYLTEIAPDHDDHESAPKMTDYCATEKKSMPPKVRIAFEDKEQKAIEWAVKIYGPHMDAPYGKGWYKKRIWDYKRRKTEEAKWVWFLDKLIQLWEGMHEVFLGNTFFLEVVTNGKQKLIEYAIEQNWKPLLTAPDTPKILRVFDWDSVKCDITATKDRKFFHKDLITGYPVYDGFTEMLFHYYKPEYIHDLLLPVDLVDYHRMATTRAPLNERHQYHMDQKYKKEVSKPKQKRSARKK